MPNTCSEMLYMISRSHLWQDQGADEKVVQQILRNSKERGCRARMLKEDSGRKQNIGPKSKKEERREKSRMRRDINKGRAVGK